MKVMTLWGAEDIPSRVCKKCNTEKPISEFQERKDLSYIRGNCKSCEKEMNRDIKRLHKENPYPNNHSCEICGLSEKDATGNWQLTKSGKKKPAFCLDHDHITKKFRGWLCHDCNRALGQFKDNVDILKNAIRYLERQ